MSTPKRSALSASQSAFPIPIQLSLLRIKQNETMTTRFKTLIPATPVSSIFIALIITLQTLASSHPKPPPLPLLPIPTSAQLNWQKSELSIFLHFGTNTYTDSEWGTGQADPSIFNPVDFDPGQWVKAAKMNGFGQVLITAKHHDGFCLWPSVYTDYSVKASAWRDGKGDVVGELAEAARGTGVGLGVYLSPWDRHEECYGKTLEYNEYYVGQMTELLTRYWLNDDLFGTFTALLHSLAENEKVCYLFDVL